MLSDDQVANQQAFDYAELISDATVTVEDTAVGLTVPAGAVKALVSVSGGAVRRRANGGTNLPTASAGAIVPDGAYLVLLYGTEALEAQRFIADEPGTPVELFVEFFGVPS